MTHVQSFESHYSFEDFIKRIGTKTSVASNALYNDFKRYTQRFLQVHGFDAIEEAFDAWSDQSNFAIS